MRHKSLFFLKTQEFRLRGLEIKLTRPTFTPSDILNVMEEYYNKIFDPAFLYRSTGVVLTKLMVEENKQEDLFGETARAEGVSELYESLDKISSKYGKHSVFLGSSFLAMSNNQHRGRRGDVPGRSKRLFWGEGKRRRVGLPLLGEAM